MTVLHGCRGLCNVKLYEVIRFLASQWEFKVLYVRTIMAWYILYILLAIINVSLHSSWKGISSITLRTVEQLTSIFSSPFRNKVVVHSFLGSFSSYHSQLRRYCFCTLRNGAVFATCNATFFRRKREARNIDWIGGGYINLTLNIIDWVSYVHILSSKRRLENNET